MIQTTLSQATRARVGLWRSPSVTVARLTLASYLRSGWMWGEGVLVVIFFAILYFPFVESTAYFNGTTYFCLGALAILGPATMVRQATSARVYLLLARLTSRAAYSQGLMLAAAALRLPIYLLFLALVLLCRRLTDPTLGALFWGLIGTLPVLMLVAVLTVALSSPIATRGKRIIFLGWVALLLYLYQPVLPIPDLLSPLARVVQLPLWPLQVCYTLSLNGTFDLLSLCGLLLIVGYAVLLALIAGRWLEKCQLQLH